MGRITDILLARRDSVPAPVRMVGFPVSGGLIAGGVNSTTALGLSSVWRCLDILSNGVSQLPWREVRGNLELPPSRLITRPIPPDFGTRREWTSYIVSVLALYDVAYLLKVGGYDSEGVPVALVPLEPGMVAPRTMGGTVSPFLPAATYDVGGVEVPADRLVILHRSPLPGVMDTTGGIIHLARITFAAAIAAEGYASRYWQSGGSPTVVLEADGQVPDPIALQISERWQERRSRGPDYAPVLSGGVKAREMGADPTAAAAVEARREQVADVGRYFGVPTRVLNAPTGDSETYSSTESSNLDLVRYTLQNYIGAIEDAITSLLPGGRAMEMETRKLTTGTQLAQSQALQLALGGKAWMDVNEARALFNLPPMEDPDELNPMPEPSAVQQTERVDE